MKQFARWCGVVYIITTIVLNVVYVQLIKDSMTNDLFWPNFTPTGAQSYLLDIISRHLLLSNQKSLDLFDSKNTMVQKYDTLLTTHTLWSSYPRSIVYIQLISVRDAIQAFREFDASYSFNLATQYCWVDFDRRWEIAHTAQRQSRCYQRYQANGAIYLEGILRNVEWDTWSHRNYPSFMVGIGGTLLESSEGQAWLKSVPNAFKSIESEVAYWTSKDIKQESISIVNVFGSSQPLTTYHIPHSARDSMWTTFGLNWAFMGDLWISSYFNYSLVRNSTNFIGESYIEMFYSVYPYTPASIVIHDELGHFESIDSFVVAPPAELLGAISTYNTIVLQAFQTNTALLHKYQSLPTLTLDAVPKSWQKPNYKYYGGSPLCNSRNATSFVQASYSFEDVCGQPKQLQFAIRPETAFFAYTQLRAAGASVKDCCALCAETMSQCLSMMDQLENVYSTLIADSTIRDTLMAAPKVVKSNVEIIQLVSTNSTSAVLRQLLLQGAWSFFGYVGLHEWVFAQREVVSFEGDSGIFVLLSEPLNGIAFEAHENDIPRTTSQYLWFTTVATSIVLLTVAIATIAIFIRCTKESMWLGRPLMLVRSVTAIIVLSTSPIVFDSSAGLGRFHFKPRSIGYRLLLASEASWLTDITTDILLVFTEDIALVQAPLSSVLFWLTVVCLESFSPIQATATVERSCTRVNMDFDLTCTSGVANIGSLHRALLIVGLNVICVIVATALAKLYHIHHEKSTVNMLPASALAFCSPKGCVWTMDASIASMCGIFRFHFGGVRHIFDTKLWIIFTEQELSAIAPQDKPRHFHVKAMLSSSVHRKKQSAMLLAGLLYLVATVVGSISYIRLADVNFGNDFWWAKFNATGTLSFIVNWYDKYRAFTTHLPDIQLDNSSFADTLDYSNEITAVTHSPLYASKTQFGISNNIAIAIRGLRRTNGCLVPWFATQYCWLDFDHQYSMATSLLRQQRCEKYQTNGAVYLEAALRNVKWAEFESCWGHSFEIGIANHIHNSSWLHAINSNTNSEESEVAYWLSHNITAYTMQWQNYKTIGLIDSFSIVNAFGFSYPIHLQRTSGAFRLEQGSSMKMYWSFANDLWAISRNGSGISGMSLLRESSNFAFENITAQSVYMLNGTLSAPLSGNQALFSTAIGPFGSVVLYHVPVPAPLLALTRRILENLSALLATNGTMSQQALNSLPVMAQLQPVPMALKPHIISGGSIMCDQIPFPNIAVYGLLMFLSVQAACDLAINELITPNIEQILFGLIASGITKDQISIVCDADTLSPTHCSKLFASGLEFIATFLPTAYELPMKEETIHAVASIELMQYIINNTTSNRQVFHQPLLDTSDPSMVVFGWMYLYDWAMGIREVVQIQGDYSSLSVISTFSFPTTFTVDTMEIPRNVSTYCRALCQYISFVLASIAVVAGLYSFLNHFTSEGFNLFEANRVGALVWIGRPLLLVRSLTALAILSTAPLELKSIGKVTVLASSQGGLLDFVTKVLAAGEVNWLVFIIQDVAMVFTRQVTSTYGPVSSIFTWIVSICLSVVAPVSHKASIHRQCEITIVDYQLECSSGKLIIGSFERFLTLIAMSFGISLIFYIYYRQRYSFEKYNQRCSGLLSCSAKYLFDRSKWLNNDLYYIDYSSAALTGLIILPKHSKLYVFDVKTWRIFIFDRHLENAKAPHLQHASPLII